MEAIDKAMEKALESFKNNDFLKAKSELKSIINRPDSRVEDVINSYKKLALILNLENSEKEYLLNSFSFSRYLFEKEHYLKSLLELRPLLEKIKKSTSLIDTLTFYDHTIQCLEKNGRISESDQFKVKYLDYCFNRKLIERGLQLISKYSGLLKKNKNVVIKELQLLLLKSDKENFLKRLHQVKSLDAEDYILLINFIKKNHLESQFLTFYQKLMVETFHDELLKVEKLGHQRRFGDEVRGQVIKLCMETIILNGEEKDLKVYKVLEASLGNEGLRKLNEVVSLDIAQSTKIETPIRDQFLKARINSDLNEALQRKEKDRLGVEKKIKFLFRSGDVIEVKQELNEYLKNYGDNLFYKKYSQRLREEKLEREEKQNTNKSSEKILEELLLEIRPYSEEERRNKDLEDQATLWEKEFQLLFKDKELSYSELKDYLFAFISLGMLDLCAELIQRMQDTVDQNNLNIVLGMAYLEIEIAILKSDYYLALSKLEYINTMYPLNDEERVTFYYLEAEVLFELKKYRRSLKIFSFVQKVRPNYRLTKERLKSIEKLK